MISLSVQYLRPEFDVALDHKMGQGPLHLFNGQYRHTIRVARPPRQKRGFALDFNGG